MSIFKVHLDGQDREMAANFAFIEMVERTVVKKPIIQLLDEVIGGKFSVYDVVDVIYCGLKANRDSRLDRSQVGDEVLKGGVMNFIQVYTELLTYAITGQTEVKGEDTPDKKK